MSRAVDYSQLPAPDEHGSFWLGGTGDRPWWSNQIAINNGRVPKFLPAVFQIWNRKNPAVGKYVPVPLAGNVPFVAGEMLAFDTPELALEWLRQEAARGRR